MAVKKQTKADFLRQWGLPYPSFQFHHLRYKNPPEKGIAWYWFSLYIRQRDVDNFGYCISCSRPIDVDTSQAGHFMPAADCGRDLLFSELNVNAECAKCNAFDETHLLGYADGLRYRYEENTPEILRMAREDYRSGPPLKDYGRDHYQALAEKYRKLVMSYPQPRAVMV